MVAYTLTTDEGSPLNARLELEPSSIILHSRGGTKGVNATNPDYSIALRLLLRKMSEQGLAIQGAWVDSSRVKDLPISDRAILGDEDLGASPEELFTRMSARMQKVGRLPGSAPAKGNSNKRIRLQLQADISPTAIAEVLNAVRFDVDLRSQQRLPAKDLDKIAPEQIWNAIQLLLNGNANHGFGESTDFDLLTDEGKRLPPKAVFGVAATIALGFEVMPKHFTAGEGSACFRILRSAGYEILPKSLDSQAENLPRLSSDELWTEGAPQLRLHVRKERGAGLANAKKSEFRRIHGKLICEMCKLDPVAAFGGAHGEASIEVHHQAVQIQHMAAGHMTKLKDLQCLCANCHRVVHRLLKMELSQRQSFP